jgi:HemY protein
MLWSVIKIILFVALIAVVTYGAGFVMDTGGSITMQFADQEVAITPIQAIIALVVFVFALWLLTWVFGILVATFKFFNGDETAISRYFGRNKEERGYKALAEGMVALAAGEGKEAIDKAATAERLLERPQLTNLISAQAAEATGDTRRALKYYKRLLQDDQTRFVGVQGLMKQKLTEGDTDTALALAEKAFALRPTHDDTMTALFDLQTEKSEWKGAQKTIEAKVRAGKLPKDVGRRREAILGLADARQLLDAGDIEGGQTAAIAANKSSPDLIPAAVLAAEMHMLNENKRAATNALKKAWSTQPHPDLAAAFADIVPDENSTARLKRFSALTRLAVESAETKLLKAELALADEDFPAARRAARELAENEPTVRSLTIMAAIEKGEGADDKTVRAWLNKALSAPRGPQWVCDSCSNIHSAWQPRCENCATFDSLSWKTPPSGEQPASAAMLGFTAGVLTDSADAPKDVVVEDAEIVEVTAN